jgi:NhaA family Na+:H+ antiporter
MKLTKLFSEFFESEKSSGLILIACTAVSLLLANSAVGDSYLHFWHYELLGRPVEFWINDGLMTVFFLLVGLEIEREIYIGELSDFRNALLPLLAALGGMLVPAAVHLWFNYGTPTQDGAGIPMATDIAFSLGVLSLLGRRVPVSLKVFLTALAIIDDLGAILVIAIFYAQGFSMLYFGLAALLFGVMLVLNRLRVHFIPLYLLLGAVMWFFMLRSGIHPTITGVLLAFAIPFGNGDERSPSYGLQHRLHYPVAFFILPVFALANTGIAIPGGWAEGLLAANSLGIMLGLLLGKPVGIVLFSLLGVGLGWYTLPKDVSKVAVLGAGLLAGIGFTMSIFITLLAFPAGDVIISSKIAVLAASVAAGLLGFGVLRLGLTRLTNTEQPMLSKQ